MHAMHNNSAAKIEVCTNAAVVQFMHYGSCIMFGVFKDCTIQIMTRGKPISYGGSEFMLPMSIREVRT